MRGTLKGVMGFGSEARQGLRGFNNPMFMLLNLYGLTTN